MNRPKPLHLGSRIALITPATVVREEFVAGAEAMMRRRGYEPVRMPNFVVGGDGSFAGSESDRVADILAALTDDRVDAIWCGRGGYGAVQLVGKIPKTVLRENPKWLIGFSDISALHAMFYRNGIMSLHAPMLRRLAKATERDYVVDNIFDILEGKEVITYETEWHPLSVPGVASGTLIGGNLSVLTDLAATPFDMLAADDATDRILFIEDVAESISRVERKLWRLRLSGLLNRVKGIIVGQFTAYDPNINFPDMESMISHYLREWNISIPVAYNFPVGHDDYNLPLVIGSQVTLEVGNAYVELKMQI
jgi:muramoyltetrapeptide carboxypeptidase